MKLASLSPLRLAPVLVTGALALAAPALAQVLGGIERDGSLGDSGLGRVVGPGVDPLGQPANYLITPEMGAVSGSNLFHSFRTFSIGTDETATFTGPDGIENVISRVTGGVGSQIDGKLRSTIPGADVWLFNPSGIVFGEHATLDVKGSFHAATADYLGFEASEEAFYAVAGSSVLATAAPAAFGFLPETTLPATLAAEGSALAVPDGETLELVGGDIGLHGAELLAPAGSILLRGGAIVIDEGSQVFAENLDSKRPGAIEVAASESLLVDDGLLSVNTSGTGNAGTIRLGSEDEPIPVVTIQNGPGYTLAAPEVTPVGVRAETTSTGAAGEIHIDAGALTIRDGVAVSADAVGLEDPPYPARGPAGFVQIRANSLDLSDGATIGAAGWGSTGAGGTIRIDLGDGRLHLDGSSADPAAGSSYWIIANSNGIPGTIEIDAGSVEVSNGAGIHASCNPNCIARPEPDPGVELPPNVWIRADDIRLDTGGSIHANTSGPGDAGRINIHADSLSVESGGGIFATTSGTGDAGRIEIDADSIVVSDVINGRQSMINVGTYGSTGDAGKIDIETRTLAVERGALINAESFNAAALADPPTVREGGDAGTIRIVADSVHVGEMGPRSAIGLGHPLINAPSRTTGYAGRIEIITRTLTVDRGGVISALNQGGGGGGNIEIVASESILLDGAGAAPASLFEILLRTKLVPAGIYTTEVPLRLPPDTPRGSIHLVAPEIAIANGAYVSSATIGGNAAGNILIEGGRIHVLNGAAVSSTSNINPLTGLHGEDAGSVTILGSELIEVVGRHPDPQFDTVALLLSGTSSEGDAGALTLRAPHIVIDEGAVTSTVVGSVLPTSRVPGSSDITLEAGQVIVRNGGGIDASTFVPGEAGAVRVTASESIVVEDDGRIESRTGASGTGGNVALSAPRIEITRGGEVSAASAPGVDIVHRLFAGPIFRSLIPDPPSNPSEVTGNAGSITLAARDIVHLDAGTISTSVGVAAGGDITIDPTFVILERGSQILATATTGTGGHIQIDADHFFAFPGTLVSADSGDPSLSGTVEIASPDTDLSASLTPLPSSFLDAASQMRERCAARRGGERAGSFAVRGAGGIPAEPDGWLPAPLVIDGASLAATPPASPPLLASVSGPAIAPLTCR